MYRLFILYKKSLVNFFINIAFYMEYMYVQLNTPTNQNANKVWDLFQ